MSMNLVLNEEGCPVIGVGDRDGGYLWGCRVCAVCVGPVSELFNTVS